MQHESNLRLTKRLCGMLAKATAALKVEAYIPDPRTKRGNVKLQIRPAVTAVIVGMVAGAKGFLDLERLGQACGGGARSTLGLPARIADTTFGDLFARLDVQGFRQLLYDFIRRALRAKQIVHDFPLRVVAMDGKASATFCHDDPKAKVRFGQINSASGIALVRTLTTCVVTTAARVCIDAHPVPPATNEMGAFVDALDALLNAYGRTLFDVVMYDSGAASLANADAIVLRELDYVLCLTDNQPELRAEAERLLKSRPDDAAIATTVDLDGGDIVERRLWMTENMAGWNGWAHLKTVVRVRATRHDKATKELKVEDRYYLLSMEAARLTPEQWLELLRRRWSVENQNHNRFDTTFAEDERPWMKRPGGMVVLMLLRRIAYNILAIWRSVTVRSERKKEQPWPELVRQIYDALIRATREMVKNLLGRYRLANE